MGNDVVLSAGVRQNLLALQNTALLMASTQTRLATGKKVNSALDNPVNFFTSAGLSSRAKDLSALIDGMSNGIKTIETADHGITGIKSTIESMKSTLLQARQDKSFKSTAYTVAVATPAVADVLTLSGGALTAPVNVDLTTSQAVETSTSPYANMDFDNGGNFDETLTFTIAANGGTARTIVVKAVDADTIQATVDAGAATTFDVATNTNAVTIDDMVSLLNAAFDAATTPVGVTVSGTGANPLVFTADTAQSGASGDLVITAPVASAAPVLTASFGAFAGAATYANVTAKTVDQLVAAINTDINFTDRVTASNDSGLLRLTNLSTTDLALTGITGGTIDGNAGAGTIGGNTVRRNLVRQYNDLRDQLNKIADDASYGGVNLLRGDRLKINFNEFGTSTIVIQAKDEFGVPRPINTVTLGIDFLLNADVDNDTTIDSFLDSLNAGLNILRSQASSFGSNLSIVQIRTEFTNQLVNTLEIGADNLVLADTNKEGANMLALQTRQQLSTTALSLASQADQAVLRLFG